MTIFIDENIPKRVARYIKSLDHEVIDIRSTDLEGSSDIKLFTEAQKHKALFITTDRDFFTTIPFLFESHHGIIVVSLKQPNSEELLSRIKWAFDNLSINDIDSTVILLKDDHYTIYKK